MAHLTGAERAAHVRCMFERIAPHYDFMNALMSGGCDQAWRRRAIAAAHVPPGGCVLDVATGTGDLALAAARRDASVRIVGVDFSMAMMQLGRAKPGAHRVRWVSADGLHLPFADGAFDAVISGFMMRNVADIRGAFSEQVRVTRPGGRVVCLEISHTPIPIFRQLFQIYFYRLVPLAGRCLSRYAEAYTYLPASLTHFATADQLAALMRDCGLAEVQYRRLMLGTVALHWGIRPG